MGKLKQEMLNDYVYNTQQGLPTWRRPTNMEHAEWFMKKRNAKWHEDMPDLTGQALADAHAEFDGVNEADDMPLWIQLELDLWEGQHGINEQTYWDVAGRGSCE